MNIQTTDEGLVEKFQMRVTVFGTVPVLSRTAKCLHLHNSRLLVGIFTRICRHVGDSGGSWRCKAIISGTPIFDMMSG